MAKYHINTLLRAAAIRELAGQHYEQGRHDRSLRVVWRNHIYPRYHISWRTFQTYMSREVGKELEKVISK